MHQLPVVCSIENCQYWENHACRASQILITSDQIGQSEPDSFDAPVASNMQGTPVEKCMETCCKTFVPRDSKNAHADDIARR